MARVLPADLDDVIAEGDVSRHSQLERHLTVRVGGEGVGVDDAPQLDLADLVGGHVRRGDRHGPTGRDPVRVHRKRRRGKRRLAQPEQKQERDHGRDSNHQAPAHSSQTVGGWRRARTQRRWIGHRDRRRLGRCGNPLGDSRARDRHGRGKGRSHHHRLGHEGWRRRGGMECGGQCIHERRGRLPSRGRVLGQPPLDHLVDLRTERGIARARCGWLAVDLGGEELHQGLAVEGDDAGEHLVRDRGQGVAVGRRPDLAACHLFRRHVRGRSGGDAGHGLE